jgi:prepilin-type N-terminal cleavage/methylation domain-containing protein
MPRPGFTLAEIAVVLLLLGILLSVALPRFEGVGESEKLKTAARRLAGMVVESHSEAATKSRPFFLCLDLDEQRAWLSTVRPGREGESGRQGGFYNLPRGVLLKDAVHPGDGVVKEGRTSFGYWPQGGNEPGALHLITDDGEELTVFLRPYMGRTEIQEGYLREEGP